MLKIKLSLTFQKDVLKFKEGHFILDKCFFIDFSALSGPTILLRKHDCIL